MRVVIDTNVFVSALVNPDGVPSQLLDYLEPIGLLSSNSLLSELERVVHYPRIQKKYGLTDEIIASFVLRVYRASRLVEIHENTSGITRDPDDDRFLACALAGGADFVVSGDRHLLEIGEYHGIPIITPSSLLALLAKVSEADIP